MCRILIADGDEKMLQLIGQTLKEENYDIVSAKHTDEIQVILDDEIPDLFLLDASLPGIGGVKFCKTLRGSRLTTDTPIVLLTSQNSEYNVVEALEAGADDYVRKPFAVKELKARVRAHLRRYQAFATDNTLAIRIIPDTFQVFIGDKEVSLTRIEFDLLRFMADHPEQWHSTQELLAGVWRYPDGVGDTALVRNHIRNLRRKIEEDPDHPDIVQSRHGRGYTVRARVDIAKQAV